MTISGSYPTYEAYESGLLMPPFTRSRALRCAGEYNSSGDIAPDSPWDESLGCETSLDPTAHSSCEFRDFCNHLYTVDFMCDCEVAWKKRAGLVLPTSA
jgi:hypothetical protein